MTGFICNSCDYRFESAKEKWQQACPYCGKNSIENEKDASTLLEEESD